MAQVKDLTKKVRFKDKADAMLKISTIVANSLNVYLVRREMDFLLKAEALVENLIRFADRKKTKEIIEK